MNQHLFTYADNLARARALGRRMPDGTLLMCAQCCTPNADDLMEPWSTEGGSWWVLCRRCNDAMERDAPFEMAIDLSFAKGCARCSKPHPEGDDQAAFERWEQAMSTEWTFVSVGDGRLQHICMGCKAEHEESLQWD